MDTKPTRDFERENRDLRDENKVIKEFVHKLYTKCVRILFSIKQIARIGVLAGCYFWLGTKATVALLIFIVFIILIQAGIDNIKKVVYPKQELGEWDLRF